MKAAVFQGPGKSLEVREIEIPTIAEDEVLLKVAHCGVCGTDIHASKEGPFMVPENTVFGHEFSGRIVELGSEVDHKRFKINDRVTALPFLKGQNIGLSSITGAYAEYVKVDPEQIVKIPDEIDDLRAALVEPVAIGLHSVKMAGNIQGKNVLIIGAGPIGLACAVWCRFFGARTIAISEMAETRVAMARKLGFEEIVDPGANVDEQYLAIAGDMPEIQIECVGAPGIIQQCIERAPRRGLILGVGLCDHPDTIVPLIAFGKELTIQWAVAYDKEDWEFTMEMMVAKRIDASAMITNVVSLEELPAAFDALHSPSDQCKVIIDLSSNN
jgi:(R,R)-butanediol dehydrogenase/meso-butanediol dehydrogenase/diacetyl reductase